MRFVLMLFTVVLLVLGVAAMVEYSAHGFKHPVAFMVFYLGAVGVFCLAIVAIRNIKSAE